MAWETLKEAVAAVIKTNGTGAITGQVLQDIININIIPQLGKDRYKGVAVPATAPGTPQNEEYYFAYTAGNYANFGGLVLGDGFAILIYKSGVWQKHQTDLSVYAKSIELENLDFALNSLISALEADLNLKIANVSNGSPKGVYPNLAALEAAFPAGNDNVYLTSNDGHWHYYNAGWQDGGVYIAGAVNGTRYVDAAIYGFSLLNTGNQNSIAINNALALGGKIVVSIPGVYEIDDTIILPSNTTIEFVKGCTLKHVAPPTGRFVNTFKNSGCIDSTANKNISIIGNGLVIDFNGRDGIEGGVSIPFAYQNGRISFYKVTDFMVSGIYVNDPADTYGMYFFELTNCAFGKIYDIELKRYPKDGIDLIHCSNIHIKDYRSTTGDDSIFIGSGWLGYDKSVGNCENITIENWISDGLFVGVNCRIITASWDDWTTGRVYAGSSEDASELCVNAGKVYRKTTSGNQTASVAPTHSTGIVTGADGIGWLVVSDTVSYANNVTNVRFINCQVKNSAGLFLWAYESPTVSQNTHTALLKDVYFNGCEMDSDSGVQTASYSSLINASCNLSNLVIKNTNVAFKENAANLGYNTLITINQNSAGNKINVDTINIHNLNFKGQFKAARFIHTAGATLEVDTVNITDSSIVLDNGFNAPLILVSNQSVLKNLNITNSKLQNLQRIFFFSGSNWFDAPIERVVNTINSEFIDCVDIYAHQYSYPNEMVIYYNAFGCQFIDTQNWIINNEQGNAETMIINFSGNKTNTLTKVITNSNNVFKKMLDLPNGTLWLNNYKLPVINWEYPDSAITSGFKMLVTPNATA